MDIGVATAVGVGGIGIGSVAVLDRIIDVTSHNHTTWAYKAAMKPSMIASQVMVGAALALAGVGLLARLGDTTGDTGTTMLKVSAGIGVGLLATVAFRLNWGLYVAPAQRGWQPGMKAVPHFRFNDLAANAVDRVHMMGRDPELAGRNWKLFDRISRFQGHGALLERTDFAPVLRYEGVKYRTVVDGVRLLAPNVP